MDIITRFADKYLTTLHIPKNILWTDIVEIIIISFLVYQILVWIRNTKAWNLLKGVLVILVFLFVAALMNMTTILWIAEKVFSLAVIAVIVVLQPELRRALEQLGRKNILSAILPFDTSAKSYEAHFTDKTKNEIVKACVEMGKVKTGALIVIENKLPLAEFERTGIEIDAHLTSHLLINIFEHNTPLHDGAVIVKGDRIISATCYLPLSENMALSKDLGTRHRAGVGVSEVTDSLTVIVSEETGRISVAHEGSLSRNLDAQGLREMLEIVQNKTYEERKRRVWKGRVKREED